MKIEHIEVYGFEAAIRGMRNPYESWHHIDSIMRYKNQFHTGSYHRVRLMEDPILGNNDITLMCKLIKRGPEHCKFLRRIGIWVDLTLPRYVWVDLDTYKVGTTKDSCSTMHKLGSRDLTGCDFMGDISETHLKELNDWGSLLRSAKENKNAEEINMYRTKYKQQLPEGFLIKASFKMNYKIALSMYFQRQNHGLMEFNEKNKDGICSFIKDLPYMGVFIEALDRKKEKRGEKMKAASTRHERLMRIENEACKKLRKKIEDDFEKYMQDGLKEERGDNDDE